MRPLASVGVPVPDDDTAGREWHAPRVPCSTNPPGERQTGKRKAGRNVHAKVVAALEIREGLGLSLEGFAVIVRVRVELTWLV